MDSDYQRHKNSSWFSPGNSTTSRQHNAGDRPAGSLQRGAQPIATDDDLLFCSPSDHYKDVAAGDDVSNSMLGTSFNMLNAVLGTGIVITPYYAAKAGFIGTLVVGSLTALFSWLSFFYFSWCVELSGEHTFETIWSAAFRAEPNSPRQSAVVRWFKNLAPLIVGIDLSIASIYMIQFTGDILPTAIAQCGFDWGDLGDSCSQFICAKEICCMVSAPAYFLITSFCLSVAILGFYIFGYQMVSPVILTSYGKPITMEDGSTFTLPADWWIFAARLGIVFAIITTVPTQIRAARSIFHEVLLHPLKLWWQRRRSNRSYSGDLSRTGMISTKIIEDGEEESRGEACQRYLETTFLAVTYIFVSVAQKDTGFIVTLDGGLALIPAMFILPCVLYLRLSKPGSGCMRRAGAMIMATFGVICSTMIFIDMALPAEVHVPTEAPTLPPDR